MAVEEVFLVYRTNFVMAKCLFFIGCKIILINLVFKNIPHVEGYFKGYFINVCI